MRWGVQEVVKTANAEFTCFQVGPADAPLALCLHGFPDTPCTWRHLSGPLQDAGWRVVAPYLRGFSPTRFLGARRAGPAVLGSDANALHEALGGDERAVIIGHDWGAAAAYAASSAEPERWASVIAASWPPVPADVDLASFEQMRRSWYVFLFQIAQAEPLARDGAFLAALWKDWAPGYDGADDVRAAAAALNGPDGATAALAHYRALYDGDATNPALPKRPTLYLHGAGDGCIGCELVEGLGQHLPQGSRVVLLNDAGHFPQLEQPAAFNEEVFRFIATTEVGGSANRMGSHVKHPGSRDA